MGEPNESGNELKGKVTLKFGDDTETYDLSNPEQAQKVANLAQMGKKYQDGQVELKTYKQKIEELDRLFNAAKDDPEARRKLKETIEVNIGHKLTDEQESKIDDFDFDNASDKKIQELTGKISTLEKLVLGTQLDLEHKTLEGEFKDYVRKDVEDYAEKNNLLSYRQAYLLMNQDKLIAKAKEEVMNKEKKRLESIADAQTIGEGAGGDLETKPKRPNTYAEGKAKTLEELKESGKSLFTNE